MLAAQTLSTMFCPQTWLNANKQIVDSKIAQNTRFYFGERIWSTLNGSSESTNKSQRARRQPQNFTSKRPRVNRSKQDIRWMFRRTDVPAALAAARLSTAVMSHLIAHYSACPQPGNYSPRDSWFASLLALPPLSATALFTSLFSAVSTSGRRENSWYSGTASA